MDTANEEITANETDTTTTVTPEPTQPEITAPLAHPPTQPQPATTDPDLQALETELQEKPSIYTNNSQAKYWLLTCNNPDKHGYDYDLIQSTILTKFKTVVYYALCQEVSGTGTPHIHLYLACSSNIRFSMLQKHLPKWHIIKARGTAEESRAYLRKEGDKHKDKACTSVAGSFLEWGDISKCARHQGKRTDLSELYEMIKDGMTTYEILEAIPDHLTNISNIERVRLEVLSEKYRTVFRELEVTYIWGFTGTGKTRGVMEKHGYINIYRVTDYRNPFDSYKGEEILVLDEYLEQFSITDMNQYLDDYPVSLRARYSNKWAMWSSVYVIANIDILHQYTDERVNNPELWNALARRIHNIIKYDADGTITKMKLTDYLNQKLTRKPRKTPPPTPRLDAHMDNPPWHLTETIPTIPEQSQQPQPERKILDEDL